jgi:enoyl-CoA hydratase
MTRDSVRTERNGAVTTVILDRPHARNAVDGPTAMALHTAFDEFDRDESASVAVLWGDNGTFCAGADLKAIGTPESNPTHRPRAGSDVAGPAAPGPMGPSRMVLSKPVIAAVSGFAVAGGLELALWCDLRIAEEDAVFGVFCRRWGVPLIDGGTVRLPRMVGQGRALEIILTGRKVPADECLRIGLCEYVTPKGGARRKAEELAQDIARFPQVCVRADRRSAIKSHGLPVRDALIQEWYNGREALILDGVDGATRFKDGLGRHGDFAKIR